MDPRFIKLSNLLIEYSLGNYDAKINLTTHKDEVDAFISSVNMLGEELKSTSISRNYFNDIFDSVSDKVFVLNKNGNIQNVNKSVLDNLNLYSDDLINEHIDNIFSCLDKKSLLLKLKKQLRIENINERHAPVLGLINSNITRIVSCRISFLNNSNNKMVGYILTVRDITQMKNFEEQLIASEEKYREVFQKSSDAIFISNDKGCLIDLNKAGFELLYINENDIGKFRIADSFYNLEDKKYFLKCINSKKNLIDFKTKLIGKNEKIIDCLISSNKIGDSKNNFNGYQVIIKNITEQEEIDNLVLRTINDTQEKERMRFSKDIHDSLGQQLSAVKFYLGTLTNEIMLPAEKKQEVIEKSNSAILEILTDLRNICFNIMPQSLQNDGIQAAVIELCRKMATFNKLEFEVKIEDELLSLNKNLEFTIFRIIQEFINNSIKHGNQTKMHIKINLKLNSDKDKLILLLIDNCKGFDANNFDKNEGMGLVNVRSRVKSYGGTILISSIINKGTSYLISIPINYSQKKYEKS